MRAVDGVSISVDRGRTVGIVGESGSGKTILSRSIMGLLPPRGVQRDGEVWFDGIDLARVPRKRLKSEYWGNRIAMVFQDALTALNPTMRIDHQLMEGPRRRLGMGRNEARDLAQHLLRSVGIPDPRAAMRKFPHEFSGGMRQRVMVAIALAGSPDILFADEPTTALDVTVQAQVLELLDAQRRERGMGMVLVTHDLGVAAQHTDEIAVMYAGRIVERAPTKRLFAAMQMPYTEGLFRSIPKLDQPPHTRLQAIPGRPPDLLATPRGCPFSPRCPLAQEHCLEEAPPLRSAEDPEHVFACWFPARSPEREAAEDVNRRRGRTAAGLPIFGVNSEAVA